MSSEFQVRRLDVAAFARDGRTASGDDALSVFARLAQETTHPEGVQVRWSVQGEQRRDAADQPQAWLHLTAQTTLALVCQRCMEAVDEVLDVEHTFRFVATESQAEAEDDESDEDVLALSPDFDLHALIEDELLMALPLVPRHEVCPTGVRLSAQDEGFDAASAEKPNPFAALAGLKGRNKP
jgi:uncharacterized protein